jgi:hypothetical protein
MTNTKPQITVVNCTTGETIIRNATNDEIAQIKIDAETALIKKAESEAKALAKSALLAKLGITEDEAKLLLA